jgi:hypothetical protein
MPSPRRCRPAVVAVRPAIAFALLVVAACGEGKTPKTYAVKGKILVDGQPAKDCQVSLQRTGGPQLAIPATPSGLTDENGEFQLTSYVANDGAPEGEYVVKIEWRDRSGIANADFGGPDRLGGEYANVEKNKGLKGFVVQVGQKSIALPPFELTQSAQAKRKYEDAKKRPPGFGGPLGGDR